MAENDDILVCKCPNPACGKQMRMHRPEKSGIYTVQCAQCGTSFKMKLPGKDSQPPEELKVLDEEFTVNVEKECTCPHSDCNKLIAIKPKDANDLIQTCPECGKKFKLLSVQKPTNPLTPVYDPNATRGGILVVSSNRPLNFSKKRYPIRAGKITIGRYDTDAMSDISIDDDKTMSRRSVRIDVDDTPKGKVFKFTVLKSTNPVIHNNKPLAQGESIYLEFGDTFILGKTKFTFKREE